MLSSNQRKKKYFWDSKEKLIYRIFNHLNIKKKKAQGFDKNAWVK